MAVPRHERALGVRSVRALWFSVVVFDQQLDGVLPQVIVFGVVNPTEKRLSRC